MSKSNSTLPTPASVILPELPPLPAQAGAAYLWINVGRRLVEMKVVCPYGTFMQVVEDQCGIKSTQCKKLMSLYSQFGQIATAGAISINALLELSKSPDPQAACSWINLGKRLCELKEACPHGTFT